jgi:type IV pilus assembly protein PilP
MKPSPTQGREQVTRISCAVLLVSLLAAGCSSDIDELQQWMDQQRRQAHATVQPLVPPKKFLPQAYEASGGVDPFSAQKLSAAIKQDTSGSNAMLAAEMNRRREPLEAYPMDSMSMVGSITRQGARFALLKVDNLLYQVKPGDYMGQNFGRITKISETDITLREVVQDAAGDWVERFSTLQLQEKGR